MCNLFTSIPPVAAFLACADIVNWIPVTLQDYVPFSGGWHGADKAACFRVRRRQHALAERKEDTMSVNIRSITVKPADGLAAQPIPDPATTAQSPHLVQTDREEPHLRMPVQGFPHFAIAGDLVAAVAAMDIFPLVQILGDRQIDAAAGSTEIEAVPVAKL